MWSISEKQTTKVDKEVQIFSCESGKSSKVSGLFTYQIPFLALKGKTSAFFKSLLLIIMDGWSES